LNYEGGKFSKSRGVGVFGTDAVESGIPADVWRFFIFYNRPERGDYNFTWAEFQDKVNGELIGNLGNLVNRTLTFVTRYYGGEVPALPASSSDPAFEAEAAGIVARATAHLERAELRDAFRAAFELSDLANKRFQASEPWKGRLSSPEATEALIAELCYLLRDLAVMIHPFMPAAADRLASFFGARIGGEGGLGWADIGKREGLDKVASPQVLFAKLEDEVVAALRERYSGTQAERASRAEEASASSPEAPATQPSSEPRSPAAEPMLEPKAKPLGGLPEEERFEKLIDLRVARIIRIERHPKADKLYIETLDDGSGQERIIVSGLVPFYKEEELLGKSIVVVHNLKSAKLRGVESRGMLLAAARLASREADGPSVKEAVEVLDAGDAAPGTRLTLEGRDPSGQGAIPEIDVDTFFSVPISALGGFARVGACRLLAAGKPLALEKVPEGEVG